MTNKEKFAKEIIEIACIGESLAVINGMPAVCIGTMCGECDFLGKSCNEKIKEWANSEYVEPPVDWSKVAVDTPILVKDNEEERWKKRHFAKYEDGKVYAYCNGATSWSARRSDNISGWDMAKLAESEEKND